ncbi:MAG: 1,4-alpha-glucan branching protein GlgB, partial [Oscillospiraceae bacterium]|nr:1,4-alpha-glucan branching protein GlgB [Oscillospiraceae bacterium]
VTGADAVTVLKADPFAAYSRTREQTASIVWNGGKHKWSDGAWMKHRASKDWQRQPISIYEVHAGSWRGFPEGRPLYRQLGDALAIYCSDMGYTHVEFLPLTEYPFAGSWGYQVTGYFAPTSRYGDPDDFKYMVDKLHSVGIGVIMDFVPAHFPKDEHGLACFDGTPLFERKNPDRAEHPQWGSLIFDYASLPVLSFLISSACNFLEEYHIDALRVDAVSSMLYLDFGRNYGSHGARFEDGPVDVFAAAFLKKLNRSVHRKYPGVFTVAEESTDYRGVTASLDKAGLGFDFKWDMGYMHDTLDYFSAPPAARPGLHDKLTFSMMYAFNERYILAYSHDEVVHGKLSMLGKMTGDYGQKLSALRALYTYQFAHPGKKLGFMGGELGVTGEWDHDSTLDWLLQSYPWHDGLRRYYRELNRIYRTNPALYKLEDSWDGFTWLSVDDREKASIAFMRSSPEDESFVVCACNFSLRRHEKFVIGLPAPGTLETLLGSEDKRYGGSGILNKQAIKSSTISFNGLPHSAELDMPPLSAVLLRFIRD